MRAQEDESAEDHEAVLEWLYSLSSQVPFDIKATASPHFLRVAIQAERRRASDGSPALAVAGPGFQYSDGLNRPTEGVTDGRGFCFISHVGEVHPSGFLPLPAGNVRAQSVVTIYRTSPLFQALRDPDRLTGKCGVCEYRLVCGGSRARAYALTGDHLASDPSCPYQPQDASSDPLKPGSAL